MYSHFKVNISNDIAELYEKMMSVKLLGDFYYNFQLS